MSLTDLKDAAEAISNSERSPWRNVEFMEIRRALRAILQHLNERQERGMILENIADIETASKAVANLINAKVAMTGAGLADLGLDAAIRKLVKAIDAAAPSE